MDDENLEILLFVSPGCPHCPRAEYTAKKVVPEYSDYGVVLKKIRTKTREGRELSSQLNVMSTPTMVFIRGDAVVDRIVGAPELSSLRKRIEKVLGLRKSFFGRMFGR